MERYISKRGVKGLSGRPLRHVFIVLALGTFFGVFVVDYFAFFTHTYWDNWSQSNAQLTETSLLDANRGGYLPKLRLVGMAGYGLRNARAAMQSESLGVAERKPESVGTNAASKAAQIGTGLLHNASVDRGSGAKQEDMAVTIAPNMRQAPGFPLDSDTRALNTTPNIYSSGLVKTNIYLTPQNREVVNGHKFPFTISPSVSACTVEQDLRDLGGSTVALVVLFVHSRPDTAPDRQLIRQTWGSVHRYKGFHFYLRRDFESNHCAIVVCFLY